MAQVAAKRRRSLIRLISLAGICAISDGFAPELAAQEETPIEILAVRVREQGYTCEQPVKAERDQSASRPLATVWLLECSNARYRIVLHPDMGAQIQALN